MIFIPSKKPIKLTFSEKLIIFILGVTGGSLYYIMENLALYYSSPGNVSILVCLSPVFLLLMSKKKSILYYLSAFISFLGVIILTTNGFTFLGDSNVLGSIFAILAAVSWSIYTFFLDRLSAKVSHVLLLRKILFYGCLSIIPFFFYYTNISELCLLNNIFNLALIFILGSITVACYLLWNISEKKIGVLSISNYICLTPIFATAFSVYLFQEKITISMILGGLLIVFGFYFSLKIAQ